MIFGCRAIESGNVKGDGFLPLEVVGNGFVGSGIARVFPGDKLLGKVKFVPGCNVEAAPEFERCVADEPGIVVAMFPGGKVVFGSVFVFMLAPEVGIAVGMGNCVLTEPVGGVGGRPAIDGRVSSGVGRSPGVATTVGNGV